MNPGFCNMCNYVCKSWKTKRIEDFVQKCTVAKERASSESQDFVKNVILS